MRERREDIPLLLDHFLGEAAAVLEKPKPTAPPELESLLGAYPFPGNIRELRALAYEAVSLHQGGRLSMQTFRAALEQDRLTQACSAAPDSPSFAAEAPQSFPTIDQLVNSHIDRALEAASGNQAMAASLLGISGPALSKRLKKRRS